MFFKDSLRIFRPTLVPVGLFPLAVALLLFVPGTAVTQGLSDPPPEYTQAAPTRLLPAGYGKIVYQTNVRSPRQIFIVGQSHRSAVSGRVRSDTVKVQAEIYRIGEWLIQEQEVQLLLPEGFFQQAALPEPASAPMGRPVGPLDNRALEARLGDPQRFVNADLLLNASYDVRLRQVENRQLYRDIRGLLSRTGQRTDLALRARIDSLQQQRTAVMLQNIPDLVDEAYSSGRIGNHRAMFTIGLAHLEQILRCLQSGTLAGSTCAPSPAEEAVADLKLLQQGYGITVIIPATLAENDRLLRLARLDAN